jgi:hypothetical protein
VKQTTERWQTRETPRYTIQRKEWHEDRQHVPQFGGEWRLNQLSFRLKESLEALDSVIEMNQLSLIGLHPISPLILLVRTLKITHKKTNVLSQIPE